MSGGDKIAELAAELLLRGVDTDTVAAVLKQGNAATASTERPARTTVRRMPSRPGYVTHEQVLSALAKMPGPVRIDGVIAMLPGATEQPIQRHMRRGIEMGNVRQMGEGLYAITEAGRSLAGGFEARPMGRPPQAGGVVAKLRELGPRTAKDLAEAMGTGPKPTWQNLSNAEKRGEVRRDNSTYPPLWSAIDGAGQSSKPAPSIQQGKRLKYDAIVERVQTAAPCSVKDLQGVFGGSEQAIRLHLQRAVQKGALVRNLTNPATWSGKARARKKTPPSRAPSTGSRPNASRGENQRHIVSALAAAKQPLDAAGFRSAVPAFKDMRYATLGVALSNANRVGLIKRVGPGLYALPSWVAKGGASKAIAKKAAPAKKPASKAAEPAAPKKDGDPRQLDLTTPAGVLN